MHSSAKQIGIAAAALAAVAAAGALAVTLRGAASPATPADLLPEDAVVALFAVRGKEDMAAYARWFPLAGGFPEVADAAWVASVKADRRTGWLLFRPTPEGSAEPYLVTASDPALLGLTKAGGRSVASSDAYKEVRPDADALSWAYVAPGGAEDGALAGWLRTSGALSVSRAADGLTLRLQDAARSAGGVKGAPRPLFDDPALTFAAEDWSEARGGLGAHLGDEPRLTAMAAMEAAFEPLFGAEVSPSHDLLPLVRDGGELHVAAGSGGLRFAIAGVAPTEEDAVSAVERLRASFRTARPSVRRDRRTFEGGETMDWMRADPGALKEAESAAGGWEALLQTQAGGPTLATAVSGERFLVSNDPSVLDRASAPASQDLVAGLDAGSSMAGMLDPQALRGLLAQLFPSGAPALPFGDALGSGPVSWTADDDGRRITVRFRAL